MLKSIFYKNNNFFLGLGIIALFIFGFTTVGCSGNRTYSWRYKMTVVVETPEGIVTGSAVREMGNSLQGSLLSQNGNPASVRGEAVVVDLGERGVLFALISSDSDMEFYRAFRHVWPHGGATPEAIKFYSSLPVGTKGVLPPNHWPGYPKLVTFKDINDPKSVTLAQEWEHIRGEPMYLKADHMEELFGEGVKLKEITLEITDEPVTWGVVDEFLPWLEGLQKINARLNGSTSIAVKTSDLSDNLGTGSFSTGGLK